MKNVLDYHFHYDSSRNWPQLIQPMQSDLSPCPVEGKEAEKKLTDVSNQHVQPASTPFFSQIEKVKNNTSFFIALSVDWHHSTEGKSSKFEMIASHEFKTSRFASSQWTLDHTVIFSPWRSLNLMASAEIIGATTPLPLSNKKITLWQSMPVKAL